MGQKIILIPLGPLRSGCLWNVLELGESFFISPKFPEVESQVSGDRSPSMVDHYHLYCRVSLSELDVSWHYSSDRKREST